MMNRYPTRRKRTTPSDVDVMALAMAAKDRGIDNPDRAVARLLAIIARNTDYIAGREERGIYNGYNDLVRQDNEALAMVIVIIESLQ